ncbi:MAG TPA: thiosulfate oxidation carrier protein SoxY [Burkholderiaceae bacterium]|nr:thiosulfate oxidation carrier protein SoxY [Burkholderiaceae bacterium]
MNRSRRNFVQAGGVLGLMVATGLITAEEARAQQQAWNKAAFEAKSLDETIKALGGTGTAQSADITLTAPDIAENGAVVPVAVASKIPNTQSIYILVEKNPNALAAGFGIPAGTDASIATRIKMGQTSNVHAVVKADNKFYVATKEVKVTLGGCGG